MAVDVLVPAPFRGLTGNRAKVTSDGKNVAQVLGNLERDFPGFGAMMFDERGQVPPHINVYVNGREISALAGLDTTLKDGDEVTIIPSSAGGSPSADRTLTPEQRERYSRHLVLPHWGEEGQRKLTEARVLVVGAGGLGSPVLLYLAGAGVGTLGIVEFDTVEISNLPRQLLHHMHDIGLSKARSAQESVADNNPDVRVVTHETRLTSENALDIIGGYDLVVAAVDNLETRYLVNDACVLLRKPMIEASVLAYEGQCTVFLPGEGCYRCLYPSPPPPGLMPTPARAGVLSITPAVMGPIQAMEAIKLILGIGESLSGRLLLFDALTMEFRQVRTRRDPNCAVCGDRPTITSLTD
ncbi:MAG: molybdopterin-synthase adenylyltransferase MoeB [Dehalococcoidia bacterium]|jgi:adenylyltransferase/sulfurtransferase